MPSTTLLSGLPCGAVTALPWWDLGLEVAHCLLSPHRLWQEGPGWGTGRGLAFNLAVPGMEHHSTQGSLTPSFSACFFLVSGPVLSHFVGVRVCSKVFWTVHRKAMVSVQPGVRGCDAGLAPHCPE